MSLEIQQKFNFQDSQGKTRPRNRGYLEKNSTKSRLSENFKIVIILANAFDIMNDAKKRSQQRYKEMGDIDPTIRRTDDPNWRNSPKDSDTEL